MRPVDQTETELGRGNCLAAAVASILEVPLADVPNFRLYPDQWGALQAWLGERGLYAIRVNIAMTPTLPMPPVACILTGPSPRNPVNHAVVGRWVWDGAPVIVHDPHPSRAGLAGPPEWVTFFGLLT